MSGYLQRLVARALPGGGPGLRPFVRSQSPIASRDQRIGLPGFEAVGFDELSAASSGEELTPVGPAPAPQAPGIRQPVAGGYVPGNAGSAVPASLRAVEDDILTASTMARSHMGRSHTSRSWGASAAALHPESRAADAPPPVTDSPALHVRETESARTERPLDQRSAVNARTPLRVAGTRRVVRQSLADDPPVQAIRGSGTETAAPPDSLDWPEPPAAQDRTTPRVEIGSIQVEVIPAVPAPQQSKFHAPPGPASAESVSRIGPLAARRRSILRFAARQR